jgi:hypothetical protein
MKERYVIKKILIFVSIIALFAISIAIAIVLIDETSHFLVGDGKAGRDGFDHGCIRCIARFCSSNAAIISGLFFY